MRRFDELRPYRVGSAARDLAGGEPTGYFADGWGTGPGGGAARPPAFVQVASASIHCLALDAQGRVFGWGCGSGGRCGVQVSAACCGVDGLHRVCLRVQVRTRVAERACDRVGVVSNDL